MMTEAKIRGLKIYFWSDNMRIIDSYKIKSKKKMKEILEEALNRDSFYITKRTMKSLIREWRAHNVLYTLHLFRKHTKDCDFESKQKLRIKIIYFILGF